MYGADFSAAVSTSFMEKFFMLMYLSVVARDETPPWVADAAPGDAGPVPPFWPPGWVGLPEAAPPLASPPTVAAGPAAGAEAAAPVDVPPTPAGGSCPGPVAGRPPPVARSPGPVAAAPPDATEPPVGCAPWMAKAPPCSGKDAIISAKIRIDARIGLFPLSIKIPPCAHGAGAIFHAWMRNPAKAHAARRQAMQAFCGFPLPISTLQFKITKHKFILHSFI